MSQDPQPAPMGTDNQPSSDAVSWCGRSFGYDDDGLGQGRCFCGWVGTKGLGLTAARAEWVEQHGGIEFGPRPSSSVAVPAEPPRADGCLCHPAGSAPTGEVYMATDADCPLHGEKPNQLRSALTRAQRMLALHSRDWGIQNNDAILWAVLHGWNGDPDDPEDCGAWGEMAARFGWSDELVADLRRECAAVEAATDHAPPAGTPAPEAAIRSVIELMQWPDDSEYREFAAKLVGAVSSHLQGETAAAADDPFSTPPGMEGGHWMRQYSIDGRYWFDAAHGPALKLQRMAWEGPEQPFDWDEYQRDEREAELGDIAAEMLQMDD